MPKKRFNIWMDTRLIAEIKREAKIVHVDKVSTYCRIAALEKMRRDQDGRTRDQDMRKVPADQTN